MQALQFTVAELATEIEAARLLVYKAADMKDKGLAYGPNAAMAKLFAAETAKMCIRDRMRDFGSIQSPQNAYLLNLGLESLHVRIKRHAENGLAVAQYLKNHEKIAWVKYCGLEGDDDYELAKKYLPDGSCGVVSFGVKGGRAAAEDFMQKLKVAAIETLSLIHIWRNSSQ